MNYKQLVTSFLRKYNKFTSAEWDGCELLTCFTNSGEPFGPTEYYGFICGVNVGPVTNWLELQDMLRLARCKQFTVDIDVYDYEDGNDWRNEDNV